MIKLAIATLGCKTNFFESAVIAEQFEDYELVDFSGDADIYLINTCTVTNRSDYKSRNLIRKALEKKKANPLAKVVVTGCFSQRSFEEVQAMGEIDFIVDNQAKLNIKEILASNQNEFKDIMEAEDFAFRPTKSMLEHSRAFQKIQDGCDFYCNYCAVPFARGHSRSAKFEDVIKQAKLFAQGGFKEIVLGGINIGLYREGTRDLGDVVEAISEIEGIGLVRLSSIEPQLLDDELIFRLLSNSKFCPHFHIPLQSGSDSILKAMGRRYDTTLVDRLLDNIYSHRQDAAVGFDLICGYPAETQALFEETYNYLSQKPISYLHVFSYSMRKGTVAAKSKEQVENKEKNRRAKLLTELSLNKKESYARFLKERNIRLKGVVEKKEKGEAQFLSDHYLRVFVHSEANLKELIEIDASDATKLA